MQVQILGCGEAFDERFPNTSMLLRDGNFTALFDCGYSVPPRVFSAARADEIDLIWISHAHADHYFGLPAVLGRWWEEGRTKPLTILSQSGVLDQIRDVLEYGYRTLAARFQFPIDYRAAVEHETVEAHESRFSFAPSRHAVSNFAIRVERGGKSFCYSGDGMFTKESAALFEGSDLLVHEAFFFEKSAVHADIGALLEMAKERRVRGLALVHVQRDLRRSGDRVREAMEASGLTVSMPEPGDILEV